MWSSLRTVGIWRSPVFKGRWALRLRPRRRGGGGGGNDARRLANLKVVFSRNKDFKFWCKITLFSKG